MKLQTPTSSRQSRIRPTSVLVAPFAALSLLALVFTASVGRGQSDPAARRALGSRVERGSTDLTCQLSSFFSFDGSDNVGATLRTEGRGLLTCKNDQGFTTELPVFADLEARVTQNIANSGELSFSANSSAFIIPREVSQLQDRYDVRPFSWNDPASSNPALLFRGDKHDLVIEMKLTSSTQALNRIEITRLNLRFDDSAPTLSSNY